MIISHKHKFIFIKVAKTASSSVELYLSKFCGPDDIITKERVPDVKKLKTKTPQNYNGFFNPLPDFKYYGPKKALVNTGRFFLGRKYYEHIPAVAVKDRVGEKIWNSYFKFCFDRNPWDKAVSAYYWLKRLGRQRDQDFSRKICGGRFPQSFKAYSINGELAVDFVGRFEHLAEDLEKACGKIGIPFDEKLLPATKMHTRPKTREWQQMYTEQEKEMVAQACAQEIELLDYKFE